MRVDVFLVEVAATLLTPALTIRLLASCTSSSAAFDMLQMVMKSLSTHFLPAQRALSPVSERRFGGALAAEATTAW